MARQGQVGTLPDGREAVKTESILIEDIDRGGRLRAVNPSSVAVLVASIAELGLQTPVTVVARHVDGEGSYRLVAGAHRVEAVKQLGEDYITAMIMDGSEDDAALWEIDENFARAELSDAQRAEHHVRREEILKRKGMVKDSPKGGRPKNAEKSSELPSYADHAARSLGVTGRTVRTDLARGKNIAPEVLAEVAGTDLDKGVVLDELAKTPRDEQPAKLEELRRARSQVKMAPDPLNGPEAHERQLAALMAAWNRAAQLVREEFLLRIDEPVFDRASAHA